MGIAAALLSLTVTVDLAAGFASARGAGAPDLHAPSVDIARVRAERAARTDAAKRLRESLVERGCDPASIDRALEKAEAREVDYGSDGSVTLVLRVAVKDLAAPAPDPIILVDAHAKTMVCGPPVFETATKARAAFPSARVVRKLDAGQRAAALARSEK